MEAGLLIGWDSVVPGQDAKATELWAEMQQYLKRLWAEGKVKHYDLVILGPHGGHLNGFILLKGDKDGLDALRNSKEFLLLNIRAQKALQGFSVVRAHFGDEADQILRIFSTV